MKITLNIPDKFVKSVLCRIIEGAKNDYYSFVDDNFQVVSMTQLERKQFLLNIKDILPEIAKNAANDCMTQTFEMVTYLSREIDIAREKIRNEEEEK